MSGFAEKVILDLAHKKLFIDGAEWPYYISEEGPKLGGIMAPNELRSVTLTFYANDVEVIPEGPLSVEEAQRRAERAQRDLVDAQSAVRDASVRSKEAQEDLQIAQNAAMEGLNGR